MKILFLAPQPFYQERGTPIAVGMLLKALSERGDQVDLVTYQEGEPRSIAGVRHHRISGLPGIRNVRPGFSFKKLACDVLIFSKALSLVRKNHYDLIHAIEEAAFIALALKTFFGIPYVYDMDSSMVEQLVTKYRFLKFIEPLLTFFERLGVRNAAAVAVVCEPLAKLCRSYGARNITVLSDISLISSKGVGERVSDSIAILYVGNLESHQGIDLLLEAFQLVLVKTKDVSLIIAGGDLERVEFYKHMAQEMGLGEHVCFLGHRPIDELSTLLEAADILVSPRLGGTNTPMKIFSYLSSGKPVIATRIPAHTEILNETVARLCEPEAQDLAQSILELIHDPSKRKTLGLQALEWSKDRFTYAGFKTSVDELYGALEEVSPS